MSLWPLGALLESWAVSLADLKKQLEDLQVQLALLLPKKFLDALQDPECDAATLNAARQYLKDADIKLKNPAENKDVLKLADMASESAPWEQAG